MNQYRSLKDLPGAPKGTVFERSTRVAGLEVTPIMPMSESLPIAVHEVFLNDPDWFELVETETLEDAVEKVIKGWEDCSCWRPFEKPRDDAHREAIENLRSVFNRIKGEKP